MKNVDPPDWIYIFHLLRFKPYKQLSPEQLKQWDSYLPEIFQLLHLMYILCPKNIKLNFFESDLNDSIIGINLKLKELPTIDKFSNKSFGAIITALNRFVPALWETTFFSLGSAGLIKTTENSN